MLNFKKNKIKTIIKFLSEYNTTNYNLLKVNEEMAEFMQLLNQNVTKHKDNSKKPKPEEVLEEFADFLVRLNIHFKSQFSNLTETEIDEFLKKRIVFKTNQLNKYLKNKKYSEI